jgi:release factor glutamine methyltransferase
MLPTPSTSHVSFDTVYEPAEDSFLFLDTLSSAQEVEFLTSQFPQRTPSPLIVEVGTGSGVVLGFMASHSQKLFGRSDVLTLGVDINREACTSTLLTAGKAILEQNSKTQTPIGAVQADLLSPLRSEIVDVLVFNPPYVPSEERPITLRKAMLDANFPTAFEKSSNLLALSYAGGADGMETTNRLLDDLPRVLNPSRGVAYILLCAQNKPKEVIERIKSWGSEWDVVVAGHSGKKGGWEVLQILRIRRNR